MFKKRERPAAARARDEGTGDGESGSVPDGVKEKKAKTSIGEGEGIIAASTRRETDDATKLEKQASDTALSGLKASDHKGQVPADDAVRRLDIDTDVGADQRAIHERNRDIHKGLKEGTLKQGVYRGQGGYKQYLEKSEEAISAAKYTGLLGPTRNTLSNVRSTLRIEYGFASSGDGGICKDYKETGYCGFGDSCKFAHDRSDYKPGWMIEREWEEKQKVIETKKRRRWEKAKARQQKGEDAGGEVEDSTDSDADSDEDVLPDACPACDKKWQDCTSIPTVTTCGHYACEDCAMENYARTSKCHACDTPTNGIFNSCDILGEKTKKAKAAAEAKQERQAQRPSSGTGMWQLNIPT